MRARCLACVGVLLLSTARAWSAAEKPRRIPLALKPGDVVPTGNEWIALPDIRASDAALETFNVLSNRDRGLLQARGEGGAPVLAPSLQVDGKPFAFASPSWELTEYWIPTARMTRDGVEAAITYCAPPGSRGAFVRIRMTNRRSKPVSARLGVEASFGALDRVTYLPVRLRGERAVGEAPWVSPGEVFSFITHDTQFAWSLIHPGSTAVMNEPPQSVSPGVQASREMALAPGETGEADFILGVGVEEFSAAHASRAIKELLDRSGSDGVIRDAAAWLAARTRATGRADLDALMNRNYLFTALYAWGRTIDTERLVGVTSRSPRYYVSAAYWDRDAMLWSFPALLDIDKALAREALTYALTVQLRNAGTHSRFIDGIVLEDGFQLDEAVAPVEAFAAYVRAAGDDAYLAAHRDALTALRDKILGRFDAKIGLFSTLQDSQDEYQKRPYLTYDNALAWRGLLDMAELFERLKEPEAAADLRTRAAALRAAILKECVSSAAPGASGAIFAAATDGRSPLFVDIPPGSLLKLPALGFISEEDPLFARTYAWLHSTRYEYSYAQEPFGLPGSYRVPFTTSWTVADELGLARGRDKALKVLRASAWDGGIVTEGVNPRDAVMDQAGRAFATAAGYVAHAVCRSYCLGERP